MPDPGIVTRNRSAIAACDNLVTSVIRLVEILPEADCEAELYHWLDEYQTDDSGRPIAADAAIMSILQIVLTAIQESRHVQA